MVEMPSCLRQYDFILNHLCFSKGCNDFDVHYYNEFSVF